MATKNENTAATPEAQLRSFNERFDPKQQKYVSSVRAALRERFPTANEVAYDYSTFFVIAYSPTEQGIDAIVSIAARADRVDLYFTHGPKLADPKKLLQGSGKQVRFIKLESVKQLSDPDVEGFISAAMGHAKTPYPPTGEGNLIIRTNKTAAKKPLVRKKAAKKKAAKKKAAPRKPK